jgi:NAD-dependent dihydropyrimidine dehydrogenase PreA subunit
MSASRTAPDGMFIDIEVEETAASDAALAAKLAEVCPVDIFTDAGGRVKIVSENLDECVLCELCINAAPAGAVKVIKLYSGETLPA